MPDDETASGDGFNLQDKLNLSMVSRFSEEIIQMIKRPITIAVLEEISDVLRKGTYTQNVASALRENRPELRTLITDKVRRDPQLGVLRFLPMFDLVTRAVSDAALRVLLDTLADPRTDELVADVIEENLAQIRDAVRAKQDSPEPPEPGTESSDRGFRFPWSD